MKNLVFLLLLLPMMAFGQTPTKTGVKFSCMCNDEVGARYATAIRDLIASSPRYQSAVEYQTDLGKSDTWNYGIRVVSLDPTNGKVGTSSVLSIVITWGPVYLQSYVEVCPTDSVKSCAIGTFADLDKEASK